MTFGRSPHDPLSSSGFGPGPAAGSQLDGPYADGKADGFGDRGPAADGFGRPPLAAGPAPLGPQPFGPANDPERPVSHADLAESAERQRLITDYQFVLSTKFARMIDAVESACLRFEVRRPKRSSLLVELVNLAASAAIAGAAGVVAELLAERLTKYIKHDFDWFKGGPKRFLNDGIKDALKKSFHVGITLAAPVSLDDLRFAFRDAQVDKLLAAQTDFMATFTNGPGRELAELPVEALRNAVAAEQANAKDPQVRGETERRVAVEWANLVARVHHGAGDWDPWAGEHGSTHGVPTPDAARPPSYGGPAAEGADVAHPSTGNVDPDSESMRDATDDDQRRMNPTLHGVLEIDLWGSGLVDEGDGVPGPHRHTHFELYRRAGGMRLSGVSPHARKLISTFSRVRDLKMNKIVAIYDNEDLRPPKPVGRFLITADGYIRRTTIEGGEAEMQDAADFAQSLSPGALS
jgi:hypothetical protein